MKESMHIFLSEKLVKKLTDFFPTKKYKTHSPLYYEGQIPISGYLVLNGSVQLSNKKKYKKILMSGALIGLAELLNKKPSKISAEVFPNTEVCFLDQSTLKEFQDKNDSELDEILSVMAEVKK